MKKVLSFIILLMLMPSVTIHAVSPLPEQEIQIVLRNEHGFTSPNYVYEIGHLDILVNQSDAGERRLDAISEEFISRFGDSDAYNYLNLNDEWISYMAFIKDASYFIEEDKTFYSFFLTYENEYLDFLNFKLIYITPDKENQVISEIIHLEKPNHKQMIDGYLEFNIDTGEVTNYIRIVDDPREFNFMNLLLIVFIYLVVFRIYQYYTIFIVILALLVIGLRLYFKYKNSIGYYKRKARKF